MKAGQKGSTLLTLAVTVAIAALITAGAGMTTATVLTGTERNEDHSKVVRQAQNLGRVFSRDAMMSESITTGDNVSTPEEEFITLFWSEWQSGDTYTARYLWYDDAGELRLIKRNFVTRDINGTITDNATMMIADGIFSAGLTEADTRWTLDIETRSGEKAMLISYSVTKRLAY